MDQASTPPAERLPLVLVVDDDPVNRELMVLQLHAQKLEPLVASSGAEALVLATTRKPDLILLDVLMPGMDGFEAVTRLKANEATRAIPVIMVSSLDDQESRLRGLAAGAEDFLFRPVDRIELRVRVRNLLRLKTLADQVEAQKAVLERRVDLRDEQLERSLRDTIATLIRVASYKDDESGAHLKRMALYCAEAAQHLGLDEGFVDTIRISSQLHDVGKVAIPDRILQKAGPLDESEWAVMQEHTTIGARMLAQNESHYLRMAMQIALGHHEQWDGTGYPEKLAGEAIPLAARIVKLADVYDTLRSKRPYRPSLNHADAAAAILVGDDRTLPQHFDPQLLAAFRARVKTFDDIFQAF
jgi:putative two-component system response regulator